MRLAFVFPGQGAQYVGMGKLFAEQYGAANEVYRIADDVLGFSLSELCFAGPEETLRQTFHTQPALLATSIAALRVFQEVTKEEIQPVCVAGHSLGEYTACVAAGSIELSDAIHLVRQRGLWMDEAVPAGQGAMAAVLGMDADLLAKVCNAVSKPGNVVELANINCPGQIVISGTADAVNVASLNAKEQGAKRVIPLTVSGPFHSSLMAPAAERLNTILADTAFVPACVPVVSNVDAAANTQVDALRDALERQLCRAVQWEADVREMLSLGVDGFIEFGPGTVLSGLIRKIDRGIPTWHVEDDASLQETIQAISSLSGL